MRRWVKCKNRLPELHEDVLMLFDTGSEQTTVVDFIRLCEDDFGRDAIRALKERIEKHD